MTFQQIVDILKNTATAVDSTATFYRGRLMDISQDSINANTNLIYCEDTFNITPDIENFADSWVVTLGFLRQDSTSSESMTANQDQSNEESREEIFQKTWNIGRQYLQQLQDQTSLQFDATQMQQFTRRFQGTFTGWACRLTIVNPLDCDDLTGNPGKVCADAQVVNSDSSYDVSVLSGGLLSLPDITVTEIDGSIRSVPAVTDVVCSNVGCPAGTAVLKTPGGATISSTSIPSGSSVDITAPQSIRGIFSSANDQMEQLDIDAETAGTYDTETTDGASGTITYSVNGGAFQTLAAAGGSITVANGDTLDVKRSTTGAVGWYQLAVS